MGKQETFWDEENADRLHLTETAAILVMDFRPQHAIIPVAMLDVRLDGEPLRSNCYRVYVGLEVFADWNTGELRSTLRKLMDRTVLPYRPVAQSLRDLIQAGFLTAAKFGPYYAFGLVWRAQFSAEFPSRRTLRNPQSALPKSQSRSAKTAIPKSTQHYINSSLFSSTRFNEGVTTPTTQKPEGKCPECGRAWKDHGLREGALHMKSTFRGKLADRESSGLLTNQTKQPNETQEKPNGK